MYFIYWSTMTTIHYSLFITCKGDISGPRVSLCSFYITVNTWKRAKVESRLSHQQMFKIHIQIYVRLLCTKVLHTDVCIILSYFGILNFLRNMCYRLCRAMVGGTFEHKMYAHILLVLHTWEGSGKIILHVAFR